MLHGKKTQEQRIDQQGLPERRGCLTVDGPDRTDVPDECNGIEKGGEKHEVAQSAIDKCSDPIHGGVLLLGSGCASSMSRRRTEIRLLVA